MEEREEQPIEGRGVEQELKTKVHEAAAGLSQIERDVERVRK